MDLCATVSCYCIPLGVAEALAFAFEVLQPSSVIQAKEMIDHMEPFTRTVPSTPSELCNCVVRQVVTAVLRILKCIAAILWQLRPHKAYPANPSLTWIAQQACIPVRA